VAKRVMVFGIDAASPELVDRFVSEGAMPHTKRLMDRGVFADSALNPHPTLTPSNWTTIATGAWPGTHGITDFDVHKPGEPLDKVHLGFSTEFCDVEYLWDAVERAGKRAVLLKYTASWPPTIERGLQVDGCHPNCGHQLAPEALYVAGETWGKVSHDNPDLPPLTVDHHGPQAPRPIEVGLKPADGGSALAAELPIRSAMAEPVMITAVARKEDGVYRSVQIGTGGAVQPGEWTGWIPISFGEGPERSGQVRFKLQSMDPETGAFHLYRTMIMPEAGWSKPAGLARELVASCGPFIQGPPVAAAEQGWIDPITFLEVCEYKEKWFADAAIAMLSRGPWDLFMMQTHVIDHALHLWMVQADPLTAKSAAESEEYLGYLRNLFSAVDRMVGSVVDACASEDTLVVIVSDHGAKTWDMEICDRQDYDRQKPVREILREAGLAAYTADPQTGREVVDWSRTKAKEQRGVHVYVNIRGRDPDGIVEPGEEYERVRGQVIDALLSHRDPKTGRCPFTLVLRREDARILGQYGEKTGDVVYAIGDRYAYLHGQQLPTCVYGISSLKSLFVMAGPGVKRCVRMERTMWLVDVVPTICRLTGWPVPGGCEGGILYQALE
jgi:predicted AlkP superfamily phosphohydrolase/phosphomutase